MHFEPYTVIFGGKPRTVTEPVFGKLRRIINIYNALPTSEPASRAVYITELLALFFPGQRLRGMSSDELQAFLAKVPELCGLTASEGKPKESGGDQFGSVYAHLAQTLGWDYDYIDNHMTMSRLNDMSDYFKRNPPTHQLVAAYLGYDYESPKDRIERFFRQLTGKAKRG